MSLRIDGSSSFYFFCLIILVFALRVDLNSQCSKSFVLFRQLLQEHGKKDMMSSCLPVMSFVQGCTWHSFCASFATFKPGTLVRLTKKIIGDAIEGFELRRSHSTSLSMSRQTSIRSEENAVFWQHDNLQLLCAIPRCHCWHYLW